MKNLGQHAAAGSNIRESGESPRTMQFLIERVCPVEGGEPPVELPIAVWVWWPSAQPSSYTHEMCESSHYRLTRDSAKVLGIDYGIAWVCEHMGYLIPDYTRRGHGRMKPATKTTDQTKCHLDK